MSSSTSADTLQGMPDLTPDDFRRVCRIAYDRAGLAIPASKEKLVRSRLARRLREHRIETFNAYCDYVERENRGNELVQLIDLQTTNKTDFFREPAHFDRVAYLVGVRAACSSRLRPPDAAAGSR